MMHTTQPRRWLPALVGVAAALGASAAYADPEERFSGTYELDGEYSTGRETSVDLDLSWDEQGNLTVERTGRYTSFRFRNDPPFTWTSDEVAIVDSDLSVTYRLNLDGSPAEGEVADDEETGLTDALEEALLGRATAPAEIELRAGPGTDHPLLATLPEGTEIDVVRHTGRGAGEGPLDWLEVAATVAGQRREGFVVARDVEMTQGVNVLEATYSLDENRLREVVKNTTRLTPEHFWSEIRAEGIRLSGPDAHTGRVKLGGSIDVKAGGRYTVIVPTDGTLELEVSGGTVALEDPQGEVVTEEPAAEVSHAIPHDDPVLGAYGIVVEGEADGASLEARFVQEGNIDERIRPWSSHTYYPIYESTSNNLYHDDGPLHKFDQVLGLEGRGSAVFWEKGTDYRNGFGFERGHYTKVSNCRESEAEADWFADLNRDGVIETADVTSADYFARFDGDEDGFIDDEEAHDRFKEGVIQAIWNTYDTDYDGVVEPSEINASFVSTHDGDGSGDIDREEWRAALRRSFDHVIASRSKDSVVRFMRQDIDEDGKLSIDEIDPPGAIDFMDSSDADGDYNDFFDRDNIALVTSGKTHIGNRLEEDDRYKVYDGGEVVATVAPETVRETREWDTVALVSSGTTHRGERLVESEPGYALYGSDDELVVELPRDAVESVERAHHVAVVADGATHQGDRLARGTYTLYQGPDGEEEVVELGRDEVERVERGVADGDLDDSYSIGWWGHCNAWSLAAIVFRKPKEEFERDGVTLTVRDQKGMLVEFGMGATEDSTFNWKQYGEDIPPDRYTKGFHEQLHRWLRVKQQGMMADMSAKNPNKNLNFSVWNYPLLGYEAEMSEAEGDDPYVLDVDCTMTKGSYSDEDSSSTASTDYRLHFDRGGEILTGEDAETDWKEHAYGDEEEREYYRYLVHPYRFTGPGDSRNPNVTLERLEEVFGEHLKYNSLEDLEEERDAAAAAGLPGAPGD